MQFARNLADEWSELPPSRRHFYVYLCLALFALAGKEFQDGNDPVQDKTVIQALALQGSMPAPPVTDGNALPPISFGNN